MGVSSCSRNGCEELMPQTYIDTVGYICYDCKREFQDYLEKSDFNPKTESEIVKCLETFMKLPKDSDIYDNENEITIDDFFNKHSQ